MTQKHEELFKHWSAEIERPDYQKELQELFSQKKEKKLYRRLWRFLRSILDTRPKSPYTTQFKHSLDI